MFILCGIFLAGSTNQKVVLELARLDQNKCKIILLEKVDC